MDKVIGFVKDHWYETLLFILAAGGFTWFLTMVGDAIEMATAYPFPLAACMVIAFLLGLVISFLAGVNRRRMKRLEARLEEAKEARQKEDAEKQESIERETKLKELEDYRITAFKKYDFVDKVYLCMIHNEGNIVIKDSAYEKSYDFRNVSNCVICETTEKGNRWTLEPWVTALLNNHPELLRDAQNYLIRE